MSKYDAVIAAQACCLDKSYERGQVVSLHTSETTAYYQAQKLQKRKNGLGTEVYFVHIHSTEPLTKGQIVPELLDAYERKQTQDFHKRLMAAILAPELTGEDGGVLAKEAAYYLAREGLSLEELKERYEQVVREEHAERVLQSHNMAHYRAKGRELQPQVDAALKEFSYAFPAVRGIQAGHEFYSAQIPYPILAKLFATDEDEVVPAELRAQRQINPKRADALGDYILENPDTYVLPSLTASVDQQMTFEPLEDFPQLGLLYIPMGAAILINDGQHRRHGIERAIRANPMLKRETASVQLHYDKGLERAQQMFADINTKQVKPSSAITALYDLRNPFNTWTLQLLRKKLPDVNKRVDFENSVPGARSFKLWSLVAIKKFLTHLTGISANTIGQQTPEQLEAIEEFVVQFFTACGEHIPQWNAMLHGDISAYDVREQFVIGHAVFLEALGIFARHALFSGSYLTPMDRDAKVIDPSRAMWIMLGRMSAIEPAKTSPLWQNRCVMLGKMMKTTDGIKSTAAQLLRLAEVELPEDLARIDDKVNSLRP